MAYDAQGREDSLTDWQGHTTTFTYDADGDLTSGTDPTTGTPVTDNYTYDPAGVLSAISATEGSSTLASFTYSRDADNQVTQVTSTGVPSDNHSYSYNPLDQLTGVDGTNSYSYDAAGDPTSTPTFASQSFDAASQLCWSSTTPSTNACDDPPSGATAYIYNDRGDRTATTPASGGATDYGWDEADQLTSVTSPTGTTTNSYDGNGLLAGSTTTPTGSASSTADYAWDTTQGTPQLLSDGTTAYLYGPDGLPLEQQSLGTTATDDFDRADGPLGANWADTSDGGLAISSRQVTGTNAGGNSGDAWAADNFSSDQYSEVAVSSTALSGGEWVGPMVRSQDDGQDAYVGIYYWDYGSPVVELFKRSGGSWEQLGSTYDSGALTAGTELELEAVGSAITLSENGTVVISATDTSLAGGAPGIMAYGTPTAGDWSGGNVTGTYSVGGTVSGLAGTVVLQDGTDQQTVSTNGNFNFGNRLAGGAGYDVTVSSSPVGQSCTVSNGSGTVTSSNITDVAVTCADSATTASDDFDRADGALGANWSDISDGGLAISSDQVAGTNASANSGDAWAAGTFSSDQYSEVAVSSTALSGGEWVGPMVRSQDDGQDAYVGIYYWNSGSPVLELFERDGGNWAQLGSTYDSGALSAGTELEVEAVGSSISLLENGAVVINATNSSLSGGAPGIMAYGTPTAGAWSGGNVTGTYSVGGNVSGLSGAVVLQDGTDRQAIGTNGDFSFATALPAGAGYDVTVSSSPVGQSCTVSNGSGTVTSSNITDVAVTCTDSATTAGDDFNRADGALGANWADISDGGLAISSDQVSGTNSSGTSGDAWAAGTFSGDQYSEVAVSSTPLSGDEWIGPTVRSQDDGQDAYAGIYYWDNGSPVLELLQRTNGSWEQLGSTYDSGALAAGTELELEAVGSAITLSENGTVVVSATDTSLAGGAPGIMAYGTPTAGEWAGGDATQGVLLWHHHDQLGSTRLLTTYAGTVAGSATYDPYGQTIATTGTTTPLGYAGAYTEPGTGLIYLINRFYDPITAQFLSVDPAVDLTQAPYSYAGDDPVNESDPSGLLSLSSPGWGEILITPPASDFGQTSESFPLGGLLWEILSNPGASDLGLGTGYPISQCEGGSYVDWAAAKGGAGNGSGLNLGQPPPPAKPSAEPDFTNPSQPPGPGWVWVGKGPPGSSQGSWYNPVTDESLHPDLGHAGPIGPHYDYKAPNGTLYRIFPGGQVAPK